MGQTARRRLLVANTALAVLLLGALAALLWSQRRASALEDYGAAPDFRLTDQLGRPVSAADLRGKVAVVNFVYTCAG